MKYKKLLFTFSFILISVISFSQQIGNGYASSLNDFNIELPSGFYQGLNPIGKVDPNSNEWNHLINLRHGNPNNNCQLQIASSYFENDRLFFRKFAGGLGSSNPDWHEIATRGGNTFNGNQSVNGTLFISTSSPEGGKLSLVNPSKSGSNAAREWVLFNMTGGYGNSLQFWSYGENGYQSGPKLALSDNGNVGIGTATPSAKLDSYNITAGITAFRTYGVNGYMLIDNVGSGENYYNANKFHEFQIGGNSIMRFLTNGNIGIGTTTPDQKLTVNGTIHSKEVIVDTSITPDYVFQKYYTGKSELKSDYVMPTLGEIEDFTRKNNHLPNVPSAKEMQENGILVGEMSNILLQKVEELTLYIIEQQKELERLKKENENFKELSVRLTEIESRLKN